MGMFSTDIYNINDPIKSISISLVHAFSESKKKSEVKITKSNRNKPKIILKN